MWSGRDRLDDDAVGELFAQSIAQTEKTVAVGIARLESRDDLVRAIGHLRAPPPTDLETFVRAYECWGEDFPHHVDGEYAVVLWDENARRLVAARDAFGSIPLMFSEDRGGLLLATDFEHLLPLLGRLVPDERMVLDYLLEDFLDRDRTFLEGVKRIMPGHLLLADGRGARQQQWWRPPTSLARLSRSEVLETYRQHLRKSTARRMRGARKLAVEVSGGLDSSSIAAIAAELARGGLASQKTPSFVHLDFPGMECDESVYADALARHLREPIRRIVATAEDGAAWASAGPAFPAYPASLMAGYVKALRTLGTDVVIGGDGGDALNYETGVFRDLAERRAWRTLVRELVPLPAYGPTDWRFWARMAVGGMVPARLRSARHRFTTRRTPVPKWLGRSLQQAWMDRQTRTLHPAPESTDSYLSNTQRIIWQTLTSPNAQWTFDLARWMFRSAFIEVRSPFLDADTAQFVLSLPPEQQLPRGLLKRLLRDTMGDMIPPLVRNRTHCTIFNSFVQAATERSMTSIETTLRAPQWYAEPYVRRDVLKATDRTGFGSAAGFSSRELMRSVTLEFWLRSLHSQPSSRPLRL